MKNIKKKIAIVTGSLVTGGAEAMVAQLASNIDESKCLVKVICIHKSVNSPIEQLLRDRGVEVTFLDKEEGIDFKIFYKLGKLLTKFKPDVVHTHISGAIYSYPWIWFHNSKMIHTLHTLPEKEFSKLTQRFLKFYYKIGKATLVTVSPKNHQAASLYYDLPLSKVKMIYNPVDINRFYKDSKVREDFVFINVGRQDTNKNQAIIIKAIKELLNENINVKLVLVGDGEENLALKMLAKDLGVEGNIVFTGIIKEVEKYLAQADVYIQTSHYEGLPLSILEAMAARLPIISTNVGGVKDVVTNNGILIEDNYFDALVNSMKKLIEDKNLRDEMSYNSYENVKKFDSKVIAQKYCELYDEVG